MLEVGESLNIDGANCKNKYSKSFTHTLKQVMFHESKITVEQMLIMIEGLKLRHHWEKVEADGVIELAKVFAGPDFKDLNISQYLVNKFNAPVEDPKLYSFYCPFCKLVIADLIEKKKLGLNEICIKCKKEYKLSTDCENYYVNINLRHQILSLLADDEILSALVENSKKYREKCNTTQTHITDIFDSEIYRKNNYIHSKDKNDVIITLNTNIDGGSMFQTITKSLWTAMCQINELPDKLRFKMILVAAAWYTSHEPDGYEMQIFVKSFVKNLNDLMTNGITITYKGKKIKVFVYPLLFPVDAKARSPIALRIGVIGHYGCLWCEIFGKKGSSVHIVKFPLNDIPGQPLTFNERTHDSYLKDVQEAKKLGKMVKGVHGNRMALVKTIPSFDAVWSFPSEYLHLLALGVSKQKWNYLNLKKPQRDEVDSRLLKIRPMREMYRMPEELKKKVFGKPLTGYIGHCFMKSRVWKVLLKINLLKVFLESITVYTLYCLGKSTY